MSSVKILLAEPGVLGMTKLELDSFLESGRLIMRLATVDVKGDPVIHPVWYLYEKDRIYLFANENSRKLQNISGKSTVYFSIDTDELPNKGVKGKGTASLISEEDKRVSLGEKIVRKYMGDSEIEYAKALHRFVKGPKSIVVEIIPRYYVVWDYSRFV